MNVKIELTEETDVLEGTSKRNGKPYRIVKQVGYLHNGEKYPSRFMFSLPDGKAHPKGYYTIDFAQSLYVGDFLALCLTPSLVIEPLKA
jgi:Helix-destabilising protein.